MCSLQSLLKSGEQCWSLAELVQAVVILAHCHSLCSFVFGCDAGSDQVGPLCKSPNGTPPTFCPFDAANGNTNVPQSPATGPDHIARRRVTRAHSCMSLGGCAVKLGRDRDSLVTRLKGTS